MAKTKKSTGLRDFLLYILLANSLKMLAINAVGVLARILNCDRDQF
jgi:hypothetical protein